MSNEPIIETIRVLNIDAEESTISPQELLENKAENEGSYILSDVDEELIILIEFENICNLNSIKIFAASNINHDEASQPQQINIYHINNMNVNFEDIKSMIPCKTIKSSTNKLAKGQNINLQKKSKNSIKFKKTKYLAIYIVSNQNDTEKTYINGITFKGKVEEMQKHKILIDKETLLDQELQIVSQLYDPNELNTYANSRYLLNRYKFKENEEKTVTESDNEPSCSMKLSTCTHLQQIATILKEYHVYLSQQDESKNDDQSDIIHNNKIVNILSHFHHLLDHHSHEFEKIYDILIEQCNNNKMCSLSNCVMMRRNQRDRSVSDRNKEYLTAIYGNYDNVHDIVTQQILDKIHCHYFHSFDIGYKLSVNDLLDIKHIMDESKISDTAIDPHEYNPTVAALNKFVHSKKQSYHNVEGLQRLSKDISKFSTITSDESHVYYSFGFRYFYWDFYKDNEEYYDPNQQKMQTFCPNVANAGCKLCDFYVVPKFDSFKTEMLENTMCKISFIQWNTLMQKATCHLNTEHFKSTQCRLDKSELYYGIKFRSPIQMLHVIAIMAYCNYDVLQSEFSKTFRKIYKDEDISSMVVRHTNYGYFGKLLRECVDCFGFVKEGSSFSALEMVVFHGINCQTRFLSVDAFIKGPVSTSTDYAVAANFSTNQGLILEFELDVYWKTGGHDGWSFFECCYLSDFSNEQEIFFIGGWSKFSFTSIIMVANGGNYQHYVSALNAISTFCLGFWRFVDNVVTEDDTKITHPRTTQPQIISQICFRLLSHQLHLHFPKNARFKEFSTLSQYVKEMTMNHFGSIVTFRRNVFDGLIAENPFLKKIFEHYFFDDSGWIQLDILTKVFFSVKEICIPVVKHQGYWKLDSTYQSVIKYLSLNPTTKLEKIEIRIEAKESDYKSFISKANEMLDKFEHEFNKLNWIVGVWGQTNVHLWIGLKWRFSKLEVKEKTYKLYVIKP